MDLLEHEGKALLARYGFMTPVGSLWPNPPDTGEFVVKAQVPAGKRGKSGGIRIARDIGEVTKIAHEMLGSDVSGHPVEQVYVEERLEIDRELYLAIAIDREAGCYTIIFSVSGGMDIEDVPEDDIVRMPINPLMTPRSFHGDRLSAELARKGILSEEIGGALGRLVGSLYWMAIDQDAELIEINPLVICGDRLIAADAKIALDDNADFRHDGRKTHTRRGRRSALEEAIAATGAVGVEVDPEGDVVAIISGAGLMMATLDLLVAGGSRVRAVVDLGGTVLSGSEGLQAVLTAAAAAKPRATFLNAFLQTAKCDVFAEGLAAAHQRSPLEGRVVVRLKGRNAEAGRKILSPLGFEVHEDLAPAIQALSSSGDR